MLRSPVSQLCIMALVSLQPVSATLEYLNVTWPAAHLSWLAVEEGFENDVARTRFESESASGSFCRGGLQPAAADRVSFPVEGARLEFTRNQYGPLTKYENGLDFTVNVFFDEVRGLHVDRSYQATQSAIAKVDHLWDWAADHRTNAARCSAGLPAIQKLNSTTDKNTQYGVTRDDLVGAEATLVVETIGHSHSSRDEGPSEVLTVVRHCTYIRFAEPSRVSDAGPCRIDTRSETPTSAVPLPTSIASHEESSHDTGFAVWGTLAIVFGLSAILCPIAYFVQKRRRSRKKEDVCDGPVYDARAARLAQTQEFVPAPDYATANAGGAPPPYEQSARK